MARSSDLNSATSQFYFNLADNSGSLDNPTNYYCVFGQVLRGTNILNYFNSIPADGIGIINMESFYGLNTNTVFVSQLPVDYTANLPPRYEDLVYMKINTLSLQAAKLIANQHHAAFVEQHINGLTNNVEYATNAAGNWRGADQPHRQRRPRTVAVDTNKMAGPRFYRIHVALLRLQSCSQALAEFGQSFGAVAQLILRGFAQFGKRLLRSRRG